MNITKSLYNGMALSKLPCPLEELRWDMVKPRGLQWYVDELEGGGYSLTLKVADTVLTLRWVGERTIENKKFLKKLMLRWYWEKRGAMETKRPDRWPFPYFPYHVPIWGY